MNFQTLLRWSATAVLGGAGLLVCAARVLQAIWREDWAYEVLLTVLPILLAVPCLSLAWLIFFRRYQMVGAVGCALGSMAVFAGLAFLIGTYGVNLKSSDSTWAIARHLLAVVCLGYAMRVAKWLNDSSFKFLSRYIKDAPSVPNSPVPRSL